MLPCRLCRESAASAGNLKKIEFERWVMTEMLIMTIDNNIIDKKRSVLEVRILVSVVSSKGNTRMTMSETDRPWGGIIPENDIVTYLTHVSGAIYRHVCLEHDNTRTLGFNII
jgi:hypothetical protein